MLVFTFIVILRAAAAMAQPTYRATLAGDREIPGPGDADGSGLAVATVDGSTLHFFLLAHNIAAPTAAHVHVGAAGTGGAVLVALVTDPAGFVDVGNASYLATGSVALTTEQAAAITGDPAGHYFNIHNADHVAGAVRGQLLGDGSGEGVFATDLRGGREVPGPGDGDGRGFAALALRAGSLYYYVWTKDIAAPTAAHIHSGVPGTGGGVVVTLVASAAGFAQAGAGVYVASGVAAISGSTAQLFLADPSAFYVNVHNGDFAAGAVRGQVGPPETHAILPIVSRAQGVAGSNWVTDVRVLNPYDLDVEVRAEWYPSNVAGLPGPAAAVPLNVVAGGQGVYDNIVASLFSSSGNGAVRLVSWSPIAVAARVYNDQRGDPAIAGTFGQFAPALSPQQALAAGAVPLLSNRPAGDKTDFRSNAGYFNPWPFPVQATFTARFPDGSVLGTASATLQPFANQIVGVFALVPGVPAGMQTQANMFLTFTAARPVFVYGSVVDNSTNDAILPLPARFLHVPLATFNSPPNGTITEPASAAVGATAGQQVAFVGAAADPDGDGVQVEWDFGDGVTATTLSTAHAFLAAGTYQVTFTATDEHGAADPTPATVTVTVAAPAVTLSQLQSEIFTPLCSGCHPPNESMDLRAGHTWGSTVNLASSEQPALLRVAPGNPDDSYLYRKVVGGPSITGSRMPQGGPYLSQAEIDRLRQWIAAGAHDD